MIWRYLQPTVLVSLKHFPVVLLTGARQAGKSTLASMISKKDWKARYITLDDRAVLDAALLDPDGFLGQARPPVIIDEVQRAPDLLRAVKLIVDRERKPGMFLLTGSANLLTLASVSETLAGRVAVHELYPFSWAESKKRPFPGTIDALFESESAGEVLERLPRSSSRARLEEMKEFIISGGFPTPASMDSASARRTWFDSYRTTYVERDLRDITSIAHLPEFGRLMTVMAMRTGKMLNLSDLSRDTGIAFTTLRRYFNILEQTYQTFLVHPYHTSAAKRLVKTPKLFMADTGMAMHLSGLDDWKTAERQNRAGDLLETFIATELKKMLALSSASTRLWFYRSSMQHEVDFLLERGDQLVGIEVKASSGLDKRDLAGLSYCRNALGKRWRMGILLYSGTEAIALDDKTIALPMPAFLGR
jgi:predicted AAA+ superfamily ATPase